MEERLLWTTAHVCETDDWSLTQRRPEAMLVDESKDYVADWG